MLTWHSCLTLYDSVWLCMTLYDSVWLCMTLYDSVWLCMTLYDSVWLCMTLYDSVWLCMTLYDSVWLCMTLYDSVWLCMTLYDSVWLCMTLYDSVWLCMTLYDSVWLTLNISIYNVWSPFFPCDPPPPHLLRPWIPVCHNENNSALKNKGNYKTSFITEISFENRLLLSEGELIKPIILCWTHLRYQCIV